MYRYTANTNKIARRIAKSRLDHKNCPIHSVFSFTAQQESARKFSDLSRMCASFEPTNQFVSTDFWKAVFLYLNIAHKLFVANIHLYYARNNATDSSKSTQKEGLIWFSCVTWTNIPCKLYLHSAYR